MWNWCGMVKESVKHTLRRLVKDNSQWRWTRTPRKALARNHKTTQGHAGMTSRRSMKLQRNRCYKMAEIFPFPGAVAYKTSNATDNGFRWLSIFLCVNISIFVWLSYVFMWLSVRFFLAYVCVRLCVCVCVFLWIWKAKRFFSHWVDSLSSKKKEKRNSIHGSAFLFVASPFCMDSLMSSGGCS